MYLDVANNKIIGVGVSSYTEKGVSYPIEKVAVSDEIYNAYREDETKVIYQDGEIVLNPNYEQEQAQKEAERIARLFLTGADVERGIYQAKGMDFDDILDFVKANPPEGLDVKALKIELKANNFYRGNPYVDAIGGLLGFTKEQLDLFFEFNDYTYLLPSEQVEEETEQVSEQVTDVGETA